MVVYPLASSILTYIFIQAEAAEFVFEPKSIQKMELMILSTLDWKMSCVTPVAFLHHIVQCLGLGTDLQWEFLRRSEQLLVSAIAGNVTDPGLL